MTNEFTKNIQDAADKVKQYIPQVSFNKNGYEIRAQVLEMAKDLVQTDFAMKFQGWEMTTQRDEKTGQVVGEVKMPEFPGVDKVLETAQKFYDFVNQNTSKK
jgi:hypothetical protein